MKARNNKIDRRDFLRTVGAAGLGSVFVAAQAKAMASKEQTTAKQQKSEVIQVPRRQMGKTGIEVPALSLGVEFNALENQVVLHKSLDYGVNYWDTAETYAGGNAALGVGKFLRENPDQRKKIFIVTKSSGSKGSYDEHKPTPADVEKCLQASLKRLNTNYIDMYFSFHGLSDPVHLTDEVKRWVESAKRRKLIRFFGFSTHENMAKCLTAAARLDWIDAIMTVYNFKLAQDAEMQAAIEACHKAGIGLVAMKTQAFGQMFETDEDKKLVEHLLKRGFTEGQAKIKVVLDDKRFSSACVGMESVALLESNVAAVLNKTELA
ncbi:MAG: aldo/keto reductase [Planctomycetota bacterium]|nr:MAG: aldo/keto reductase [Planctomycetota bacterium]